MLGDLWSFQGRYRTLHLTWIAFVLTFVVWFNLAPLATTVKADLGLDIGQIRTVAIEFQKIPGCCTGRHRYFLKNL